MEVLPGPFSNFSERVIWECHHNYVKVILKTTPDIEDIWSCPWYSLEQPGASKVVPDMAYEGIVSPRPRSPICPRTTLDIQGCSQHGLRA